MLKTRRNPTWFFLDGCEIAPTPVHSEGPVEASSQREGVPPMSSSQSVTQWLGRLRAGDRDAAQALWSRYFEQLVRLARARLRGTRRRAADEEDVALSALESFCRGAADGRFPHLQDRHGLWPLLVAITARKAIKLAQYERRQKRGGGAVRGDSALAGGEDERPGWEQVLGREPSPAFACQVADQCRRLLELLPEETLRSVAQWKMEGYTNADIAAKLGCIERTVERKLRTIRRVWEEGGA
jgi:DNA-directed RNA polymerase specialized sigma24 family protein